MLDWHLLQRPGIIFWWPYVLSSWLITFGFLVFYVKKSAFSALRLLFVRRVWLCKSSLTDLIFSVFYALVLALPVTAWQVAVYHTVLDVVGEEQVASPWSMALPSALEAVLVSVYLMIWIDLATYLTHRALHKIQCLWPFHAVHHSARQLTLFTTHRQHPFEPFLLNTTRGAAAAIGLALFYWFFPQQTPVPSILGVSAGFFFYMFTVNLQHSHIPVRYPAWLARVILSPHAHHLHHSRALAHRGCNFGVIFSIWDKIFGTYRDEMPHDLEFGLPEAEDVYHHSIWRCLLFPLREGLIAIGLFKCFARRNTTGNQDFATHD